jgi:hypothetical protein
MLFAIPYPILYPEHYFGIGYPYPPDLLKIEYGYFKMDSAAVFGTEIILSVYTPR